MSLLKAGAGKVEFKEVEFDIADLPVGVAVDAIALPNGAEVIGGAVVITTAFDSATTDTLSVGDAGAANRYLNAGNIHATGRVALVPTGYRNVGRTVITLTRALTGTAAEAGAGRVRVEFILPGRDCAVYD